MSVEKASWRSWPSDNGKNRGKILKDRLQFGYFEDAELIAKNLPAHEVTGIGTKQYYKFMREGEKLHAAGVAKACRMFPRMRSAANDWFDQSTADGMKSGTAKVAKIYGASLDRIVRATVAESTEAFKKGGCVHSIEMLESVGLNPKVVLKDLAQEGFERAAKEGNELVAKYIANHALDIKCGCTIDISPRTEETDF